MPSPLPAATVENSWLIYDDPAGKFHLLYPEDLSIYQSVPELGLDLAKGDDMVQIRLVPKSGDPARDRNETDWIQNKRKIENEWKQKGQKFLPGPASELPPADWAPLKRKVYRMEFALLPQKEETAPKSQRFYMDRYLVLFTRNETLQVTAWTTRDPHIDFRNQAETLIRNFNLGPSDSSLPARPARNRRHCSAPVNTVRSTRRRS